MSMCRVVACAVGRGCLLWQMHSLGKTFLALLHFLLQGQTCLLLQVSVDFYFCIPVPYDEKDISLSLFFLFLVLVLEGLLHLHRNIQLQLFWYFWSGDRLGLLIQNGLPWKWTEIILLFLRLHPSAVLLRWQSRSSSSKARTPKFQQAPEQPFTGECWLLPKTIPHIQGTML